ncbi:MAG: hypothetical protein P8102_12150 [Gammaproteobacteria bacterium]
MKWLPWRYIISRAATKQGFLDPIALLSRLHGFAQPSEVGEPIELLRAGVVFHARGLINSRVIQHNLDWVWPYWIQRQFDPTDSSFIPRAFSITHINLTHRNWTAVGYPDCAELPIVDPRGLLTPLYDGWSLDCWLLTEDGRCLLPSRAGRCRQVQQVDGGVRVSTETESQGLALSTSAWVELDDGVPVCRLRVRADSDAAGSVVLALRPYNPEGISFVNTVQLTPARDGWVIDGERQVGFSAPATHHQVSDYRSGDVYIHLDRREEASGGRCDVGMVTAAAFFPATAGERTEITATIPLAEARMEPAASGGWASAMEGCCRLACPEPRYQFLYDAAVRSLVLHSPGEVYPGPYTYKRFWFRDAAFIIHALLCAGLTRRAERALDLFPDRQTSMGYFRSQEGEWDSNGEALWIIHRFCEVTGSDLPAKWRDPVIRAARWILRKRLPNDLDAPHAGLLPAGFSAEHLGPNDYYYWDDFWGIAGLRSAAALLEHSSAKDSLEFARGADDFSAAVDRTLEACARRIGRPAMPASPYRRMDAGAIGSLAMGYPAQLCDPEDPRLLDTVEFLLQRCFVHGGFYQDMIHSGINAYLTLHTAQVLLRAGDNRHLDLMDAVADLASPTGQWPEAIHPLTGGGCMGDGHHVWAAAEWLLMIRNCFLREEGDRLVLLAGLPQRWLEQDAPIRFGPAPTSFGSVTLTVKPEAGKDVRVEWTARWHAEAPEMEIRLPGFGRRRVGGAEGAEILTPGDRPA